MPRRFGRPRAASEGAVRRKERPTAKGVVGNTPSTSSGCMWVDERRHRKGATELQSKKSQPSEDIYDQVSSLVEELKSARARALAAGGQLPRAVEAAASALEPLLRLRDVTGGSLRPHCHALAPAIAHSLSERLAYSCGWRWLFPGHWWECRGGHSPAWRRRLQRLQRPSLR